MVRLTQYQRKTIEQVIEIPFSSFVIRANQEYFLHNSAIFLAGVSDGVGNCADLNGKYLAVFTKNPTDRSRVFFPDPTRWLECSGAVLLRDREKYEIDPDISLNTQKLCQAVNGLRVLHKIEVPKRIFFAYNGKTKVYSAELA